MIANAGNTPINSNVNNRARNERTKGTLKHSRFRPRTSREFFPGPSECQTFTHVPRMVSPNNPRLQRGPPQDVPPLARAQGRIKVVKNRSSSNEPIKNHGVFQELSLVTFPGTDRWILKRDGSSTTP